MGEVLWLSGADVEKTGVCRLEETVKIVEEAFGLFDRGEAFLVPETALHLTSDGQDGVRRQMDGPRAGSRAGGIADSRGGNAQ